MKASLPTGSTKIDRPGAPPNNIGSRSPTTTTEKAIDTLSNAVITGYVSWEAIAAAAAAYEVGGTLGLAATFAVVGGGLGVAGALGLTVIGIAMLVGGYDGTLSEAADMISWATTPTGLMVGTSVGLATGSISRMESAGEFGAVLESIANIITVTRTPLELRTSGDEVGRLNSERDVLHYFGSGSESSDTFRGPFQNEGDNDSNSESDRDVQTISMPMPSGDDSRESDRAVQTISMPMPSGDDSGSHDGSDDRGDDSGESDRGGESGSGDD